MHRHPVLRTELSLQGETIQLVCVGMAGTVAYAAEPGCHGAGQRGHGEMLILYPAD